MLLAEVLGDAFACDVSLNDRPAEERRGKGSGG